MLNQFWIWPAVLSIFAVLVFNVFVKFTDGEISKVYGIVLIQVAAVVPPLVLFLFYKSGWGATESGTLFNATSKGVLLSLLAGIAIGIANIAIINMYHLKAPLSLAVPFTRVGGTVLAVIAGIVLFSEILTVKQILGICLGALSIILLI